MSIGRILTGGLGVFGGRRFLPTLGYGSFSGVGPSVAIVTTRLTLVGTSQYRGTIEGVSAQRLATVGTSGNRLTIEGSST